MLCVFRCCKACCCRTIRSPRSVRPSLHSQSSLGPSRSAAALLGLIFGCRLHLHNNLITEVPAFAMMPSLLDLTLSNNKIQELPAEISNLHQVSCVCCCQHLNLAVLQLQLLALDGNAIARLPAGLCALQHLSKLQVSSVSLHECSSGD